MRISAIAAAAITGMAVLFLCPVVHAAQADPWKYVHPDAKVLMGIDWARAKNSPGGRVFAAELADMGAKAKSSGPGFEVLESVDRILISTSGRGELGGKDTPMIIAIEGRLDLTKIKKMLPAGTALERFKGVDLYVPPKTKPNDPLLAVLSSNMMLFGPRQDLAAVLDGQRGSRDLALSRRAESLASQCEFWIVATETDDPKSQMKDVEAMELGVSLATGLALNLDVTAKTEAAAQGFVGLVQVLASMAAKDAQKQPAAAELARSLQVKLEGKSVRIRMDVPADQLRKSIAEMKVQAAETGMQVLQSMMGVPIPGGAGSSPKTTTAPPPLPPEKQVIKIYGMEGGPVEIPYGTPPKKEK